MSAAKGWTGRFDGLLPWVAVALVLGLVFVGFRHFNGTDRAGRIAGVADLSDDGDPAGILWEGEGSALRMGANGWFFVNDGKDRAPSVINARTGERWSADRLGTIPGAVTSGGLAVVEMLGDIEVHGPQGTHTARAVDILAAFGDRSLRAGEDAEIVALSATHVVVATCLAPEAARLGDDVAGGRQVLAGIRLDGGTVTWTRDLEVGCDAEAVVPRFEALPDMPYLPVVVGERTRIVAVDTGKITLSLDKAPRGRVIVQDERVIHREGDTVTARSIADGAEIATTSCPGARLSYTGDHAGLLAPQGVAEVRCGGSVRLLGDDAFVTVDVPPVGEDQLVPDGESRVFDRLVMRREGGTLHLRDALTGTDLGNVEVPAGHRVGTSKPRGYAVLFFDSLEKDNHPLDQQDRTLDTEVRIVDARTGDLVVRTKQRIAPGSQVTPDGYVGLVARLEEEQGRPGPEPVRELPKPASEYIWVVATGE